MDKDHLASCHCKTSHPELFLYKKDGSKISFRSDDLKDKIEYVHDTCEDALRWENVIPNSKDHIWSIYCPIYGTIKRLTPKQLKKDDILKNLLKDSWDILKPGGNIFINIPGDILPEHMKSSMVEWSKENGNHPWKIEVVDRSSLDYIVHDNRIPKFSQYIILTKPITGAKRTKTLRNKRIRNVTKYRRIR